MSAKSESPAIDIFTQEEYRALLELCGSITVVGAKPVVLMASIINKITARLDPETPPVLDVSVNKIPRPPEPQK